MNVKRHPGDEQLRQGSAVEKSASRIITSPLEINRRNFLRSSLGALAVPALNRVNAGVIPVGANPRLFEQEGARYAGPITTTGGGAVALQISYLDSRSPTGRSLFYASGAIINERTVITAAHALMTLPGSILRKVIVGANFRANDAAKYGVEKIISNPLFTNIDTSRADTFDLAVIITEPIKDTLSAKMSTTPLPTGEIVKLVGCGRWGTEQTGLDTFQDGLFRAGTSLLDNDPIPGESREFYRRAFFQPTARPGDMRGAWGDSGGPVFRLDGQGRAVSLAGLMVSASTAITGRSTGIIDLSHPDVQAFIRANVAKPDLTVVSNDAGVSVSWSQTFDFVLQMSPTPSGVWNNYLNTITTSGGISRVMVSHPAKEGSKFFRLVRR